MSAALLGIGCVNALGTGLGALAEGLEGRRAPATALREVALPTGPARLLCYPAPLDGLERFTTPRQRRRLDRLSRLTRLAAGLALEDAGLQALPAPAETGISFATAFGPMASAFGFQDQLIDHGDAAASPTAFSASVHNGPASALSLGLGIGGPAQTLTGFGDIAAEALATALFWIETGRCRHVLCGGGEELAPLLEYGAALLAGEADLAAPPRDDDPALCRYRPGEACTLFLLGPESEAGDKGLLLKAAAGYPWGPDLLPADTDRLYLAARGEADRSAAYARAREAGFPSEAHTGLWGSMPTGLLLEVAAAGLVLRGEGPRHLACLDANGAGGWGLVRLGRG